MKMKAEQYLMLGEDPPGVRLELVDGAIAVSPAESHLHGYVNTELRCLVVGYLKKKKNVGIVLGGVDTIFDDYNVRRPDILFLAKSRLHLLHGHAVPIAPDLCVEILSPSSATMDQVEKFALYAKHGVTDYWIVDPKARSIEGYHLKGKKYVLSGSGSRDQKISLPPFPDLKIPLFDLWLDI